MSILILCACVCVCACACMRARACVCVCVFVFSFDEYRTKRVIIWRIRKQCVNLGLRMVDRSIVRRKNSNDSSGIGNTRYDKPGYETAHISNRPSAHFSLFFRKLVFAVPLTEYFSGLIALEVSFVKLFSKNGNRLWSILFFPLEWCVLIVKSEESDLWNARGVYPLLNLLNFATQTIEFLCNLPENYSISSTYNVYKFPFNVWNYTNRR